MTLGEILITVVAGAAIVIGILGTLLPILPGLILVWVAMAGFGLIVGFGWAGWLAMIVATALLILGFYLNVRIPQRRAAATGLTTGGQLAGVALAIIGFFTVPVVGAPAGFVFGVYAIRLRSTKNRSEAWSSTRAIIASLLEASAAQAACGVGMATAWLGWVAVTALT